VQDALKSLAIKLFIFQVFTFVLSDLALAVCSGPSGTAGKLIYNKDYHVAQYCDGSAWIALGPKRVGTDGLTYLATGPANTAASVSVWADENYVFVCDTSGGGLDVYSFNGTSFTFLDSNTAQATAADDVWGDGSYIYVADGANGVDVYSFNGSSLSYITTNSTQSVGAYGIRGNGSYIYVADYTGGVDAYSFNGTTLTYLASNSTNSTMAREVWADSKYVYVADDTGGLDAYSFNGTAFTYLATTDGNGHESNAQGVWSDGKYIFVADMSGGIDAYTFDGTAFTWIASSANSNSARDVWGDGKYIYVADGTNLDVYTFNGTSFSYKAGASGFANHNGVWGNSQYLFIANYPASLQAFRPYGCQNPVGLAGEIRYSLDWRALQVCDGLNWNAAGPKKRTFSSAANLSQGGLLRGSDLTGNIDSKLVTGSFWLRYQYTGSWAGIEYIYQSDRFNIYEQNGKIYISGNGTGGGASKLYIESTSSVLANTSWHHFMFSFDMTDTANCTTAGFNGKCKIFKDGIEMPVNAAAGTFVDDLIDFTRTEHGVGGIKADIDDFWLSVGTYIDFSVATNREKFRSS
jgi:hypothetical protein